MSLGTIWGDPALFAIESDETSQTDLASALTTVQKRILVGACNYYALEAPGATLQISVHLGDASAFPRLTNFTVRRPESVQGIPRLGRITIRSLASGTTPQLYDEADQKFFPVAESGERYPVLTPTASNADEATTKDLNLYWRARQLLEHRFPLAYDFARQTLLQRREVGLGQQIEVAPPQVEKPVPSQAARAALQTERPRAALFGLHWLDLGGAERWAFETIRLAREAGLIPVVITDRDSHHLWADRPELAGALLIPLSHPLGLPPMAEPLLEGLAANFDIAGVFIHHCSWLYDRLSWLKALNPAIATIDTLHIIEYNGGGYPAHSVIVDDSIDIHHVISPQLERWLIDIQRIDSTKVVMHPLIGLTEEQQDEVEFVPRRSESTFTVGFIGRFARQKRPYLFLQLVRELQRKSPGRYRFIVQGDGELFDVVRRMIRQYRLETVVELRDNSTPVASTFADIDLLVISSQNEGITLTTLEAVASGVPVISTDVGSQSTLVQPLMLVSRKPHAFVEAALAVIEGLASSEDQRRSAWTEQRDRVRRFSDRQSANDWAREVFDSWSA